MAPKKPDNKKSVVTKEDVVLDVTNTNEELKKKKLKAMMGVIKSLEKEYQEEGILHQIGDKEVKAIEATSSGSLLMDIASGIGGFAKGRIYELFGAESSGKTLIATRAMAECQRAGGVCALIDAEHAFDPGFAAKLGLNSKELFVAQPSSMEQALTIVDEIVQNGAADMIVIDSVAAMAPKAELDGEVGKANVALQARIMSPFLRRITSSAARNKITVIFINQIRDAVGVMYGDPTTTPGGKALKFYASVRIQVARIGSSQVKVKRGGEEIVVGHGIRTRFVKNKCAAPYRKAEFTIYYDGRKPDPVAELVEAAIQTEVLVPNGRTYTWPTEPEFRVTSRSEVVPALKNFPKVQEEIKEAILKALEPDATMADPDDDMDSDDFDSETGEVKKTNPAEEIEKGGWDSL